MSYDIYNQLLNEVQYAKKSVEARELLYKAHGAINMARQLGYLTQEQYMELEHLAVYEGINNPKYF